MRFIPLVFLMSCVPAQITLDVNHKIQIGDILAAFKAQCRAESVQPELVDSCAQARYLYLLTYLGVQ